MLSATNLKKFILFKSQHFLPEEHTLSALQRLRLEQWDIVGQQWGQDAQQIAAHVNKHVLWYHDTAKPCVRGVV